MAQKRAHEVRTAITSNLPVVSRSDFFLNMIHAETRSRYFVFLKKSPQGRRRRRRRRAEKNFPRCPGPGPIAPRDGIGRKGKPLTPTIHTPIGG